MVHLEKKVVANHAGLSLIEVQATYLGHGILHNLLVLHITLVSDKQLVDTLGGVSVDLLEPLLHVVERIHVGDIVHDTDTVGTTVVRRCDGTETFLASGIPLECAC